MKYRSKHFMCLITIGDITHIMKETKVMKIKPKSWIFRWTIKQKIDFWLHWVLLRIVLLPWTVAFLGAGHIHSYSDACATKETFDKNTMMSHPYALWHSLGLKGLIAWGWLLWVYGIMSYAYIHIYNDATKETFDENTVCDVTSLCLVTFIGLEGVDCLRMAQQLVLKSFLDLRETITRIVNSVLPKSQPLSPTKFCQIISLMKLVQNPLFARKSTMDGYLKELHCISTSTGWALTAFVAPPISYNMHSTRF